MEVKWIKIVTNIFDDEKVRYIESLPNGDESIVIWFRILCLAGKSNSGGLLMMTDRIAYTDEMLASIFQRDIKSVQLALNIFENLEMIERFDNKIYLTNWEKHQNVNKLEEIREQTRKRVARHRESKLLEMETQICSYCGEKATGVDHIVATARGGVDEDINKIPCCIRCNRIKNDKPVVDFLNFNRNIINDEVVANNKKLKKHINLCNVTDRYIVTQCNATELELEEEIEIDKDIKKKNGTNKFVKPTLEEVSSYCLERKNTINPQYFIDYQDAREWVLSNGKKMKDWKATIRYWEQNGYNKPQSKVIDIPSYYTEKDDESEKAELLRKLKES